MTPKKKADKLCIDFLMKPNTTDIRFGMDKQLAKQCALIAVEKIIASNPIAFDEEDNCIEKQWWNKVKQQIELL